MHLKSLLCKAGAGRMTRFSVKAYRSHCNRSWISFKKKIPCPQPLTVPKLLDGLGIVEMVDHWTTGWIWNGPKQPHCLGTAGWMLTYHSISTNRVSIIAKSFEVLNLHKDHLFWSGLILSTSSVFHSFFPPFAHQPWEKFFPCVWLRLKTNIDLLRDITFVLKIAVKACGMQYVCDFFPPVWLTYEWSQISWYMKISVKVWGDILSSC